MRTKKVAKNALMGLTSYGVLTLSNFITRKVFIDQLGIGMVGVESLFRNFISMLALAELGLSTGLTYKLYKPLAENDFAAVKRVLNFYKRAFQIISVVMFVGGIILSFIVPYIMKPEERSQFPTGYISLLFVLYVGDVISSYLFANRKALIVADQNNYIVNRNDAMVSIITMISQVALLYVVKSFVVYAVVKIVCRLIGALSIGHQFKRMYPQLAADKSKDLIDGAERRDLMTNMGAMLCHKVGALSVSASGSAVLMAFVGQAVAGIYGNYTMITNTVSQMITQIFNGVTASFGNMLQTESKDKVYDRFNMLYLLNYLIYSFCSVSIFVLVQPFVSLWTGEKNLFPMVTVGLLVAYFYIMGIRRVILMAKDSVGMFRPDCGLSLLEAGINIGMSLLFVQHWGANGVILASVLSMLIVPLWSQPYLVYRRVLERPRREYYARYVVYLLCVVGELALTFWIASLIPVKNLFLQLLIRAGLCLVIPHGLNLLIFGRTKEFKGVWKLVMPVLAGFLHRKKDSSAQEE